MNNLKYEIISLTEDNITDIKDAPKLDYSEVIDYLNDNGYGVNSYCEVEKYFINKDDFYNKFKGFTRDQIDSAILNLNERDIEIINLFYGLKDKRLSIEEISVKLNVEKDDLYERIYKAVHNIGRILKNDQRVVSGKGKKKKVLDADIKRYHFINYD